MDKHEVQGRAAAIVSMVIIGILKTTMVEEALKEYSCSAADIAAVKKALEDIANEQAKTADYHKSMMPRQI